jgi:hypothetical protein
MTRSSDLSEQLEQRAVEVVECSIPEDMTIAEWRRLRPRSEGGRRWRRRSTRTPEAPRHLAVVPDATCDHLHGTTSRYDRREKRLTFLLVCGVCETERVIETISYEPRFEPLGEHAARKAA